MFKDFKVAVQNQFDNIKKHELFIVDIDKDSLWDMYLSSFPEGTNIIYKERSEYDCQACKSFIRNAGNIVAIIDIKIESIWDIEIDQPKYQTVADSMSKLIKSSLIKNVFLCTEKQIGIDKNIQLLESGDTKTWEHFFVKIPNKFIINSKHIGSKLSEYKSARDVFFRSLSEVTMDAVETIIELIDQNSLYRGEENRFAVSEFGKLKKQFDSITNSKKRELFCWSKFKSLSRSVTNFRNTAVGTLLVDISNGRDLESSVKSFESKVAPASYKRPTAIITKSMISNAQKKVEELGFTSALERRYAVAEDITINNVIFANREAKIAMNVFDELSSKTPEKVSKLIRVEPVNIDTFIHNILPKANSIELMFENRHSNNLVSLIAPVHKDAKGMFKWHNNFSWTYAGDLADSIKQRVKNAGGNVEGDLRCSLSWFNYDDLDIHLIEPDGNKIYYGNKYSRTGGNLDVDMNANGPKSRSAVENISYPNRSRMLEGKYRLVIHNYSRRESIDVGFEVEVEFDNTIHSFSYAKALADNKKITVVEFEYTHKNGLTIIKSLPTSQASKEIWGISTQQFHNVKMIMYSPNYWDSKSTGNKHFFFMLENCLNEKKARGFFNEFLTEDLREHRKVFEVLGSKMKAEESDNQLSGLGFSSTQRNSVFCRVKGSFNRVIRLTF